VAELFEPLVWSLVAPLVGGCLLFVVDHRRMPWLRMVPPLATVIAALALVVSVATDGTRTLALGGWSAPLGITLRADGLSAFMVATSAGVGLMVSLYALSASARLSTSEHEVLAFWPLWSFTWLGLNAVFLCADLFNLYVALEVLGIAAVSLVTLAGGAALAAAMRYVLVTLVGSLFFLLGIALLYADYGVLDMLLLASRARWTITSAAALGLMTLGLACKAALFPLHFWLPSAHAKARAPVSAILSGLVCIAPFYLVVRLWTLVLPEVATLWSSELVGALGMAAIAWGSVQALRQRRLKMLVAYSTVAQMGYLFLLVPLSAHDGGNTAFAGSAYYVTTHACAKGAMFLAAGTFAQALGTDTIADLRGASVRLPMTTFSFALAGITLIGLPPTGGFIAKWLLLQASIAVGHWMITAVILVGSLLTAAYVLLPLERALRGSHVEDTLRIEVPLATQTATFTLALAGVLLGVLSYAPISLLEIGRPVAAVSSLGRTP
jgi:multicomponent Na+:H+ antiporter subunit D